MSGYTSFEPTDGGHTTHCSYSEVSSSPIRLRCNGTSGPRTNLKEKGRQLSGSQALVRSVLAGGQLGPRIVSGKATRHSATRDTSPLPARRSPTGRIAPDRG